MLFVVRDAAGKLVGRINVGDIEDGSGQVGYRIAAASCGRGHARAALGLVVEVAASRGLAQLEAMTAVENVASRRVLEANGFERLAGGPAALELGGRLQSVLHFVRVLPRTS